jgi:hypothetical protein
MVAGMARFPSAAYPNLCSLMGRTEDQFRSVKRLAGLGLSDYKIAQRTGIPRSTVLRWRHRHERPYAGRGRDEMAKWTIADPLAYCYLLGAYLGDGHLSHGSPNSWTLRIACDQRYPAIIDEVRTAMIATFPGRSATRFASSTGASDVVGICHPAVGRAFPQHGPGRKHLRPIVLDDWQLELTRANPASLIRGLIHSDGCRVVNRFRTKLPSGRIASYSYIRYFFSNLSVDIRRIFTEHCELLGIRVTQSNHRNLTVSHRDSVAILEDLVGPKS